MKQRVPRVQALWQASPVADRYGQDLTVGDHGAGWRTARLGEVGTGPAT